MATTQAIGEGLTFDKVWAALMENREQMRETDRKIQETREMMKETDRQMKETDRRLGMLGNRFGEMVEYMVIPNLVKKFKELGFTFTKANRTEIEDEEHDILPKSTLFWKTATM